MRTIFVVMAKKKKKRTELKRKLLHKYRLVILNESTFEEKISFKLSRLNVFVAGTLLTIGLISLTILLIAFTPLREYIPGYSSTKLKKQATDLTYMTDSLVDELDKTNRYLKDVQSVLRGEIENTEVNRDSLFEQYRLDPSTIDLTPIREDSLMRAQVALDDKYNLFERDVKKEGSLLFLPAVGLLTQNFDIETQHYAVDVTCPTGTPVKSVARGTVIFAEWTTETGYVIMVEHAEGLLSVYKHNGTLEKKQGELVQAGEVIASVGNTGELTTGPHLHFELWKNGNPLNPQDYIDFK